MIIIGITGTLGAGKGAIVERLKNAGFKHFSMSGFIAKEVGRRGLPVNRDTLVAQEVFTNLGVKSGAIINSGMSYHGWGLELLTDDDWRKFMAKALLLDRIDRRWVGHRLIDGQANIRISEKRRLVPKVVYVF